MKYLQSMTRAELGGSRMTGDVLATLASGDLEHAHGSTIKALRKRGLLAGMALTVRGLALQAKLKGLA